VTRHPRALDPSQSQAIRRSQQALQAGRSEEALRLALDVARRAPDAPDAQHTLALCLAQAGRWDDAGQAFREALALAPGQAMIELNYARMLRRCGRSTDAIARLEKLCAAATASAASWSELGLAALDARLFGRAATAFEQVLRLQPGDGIAWHGLGNARRALGDMGSAATAFRRAIELDAGAVAARLNLGATLRLMGRSDEALACFDECRARGYREPGVDDARVGALIDLGRLDEALAASRALVAEHPSFIPGHVTLAQLLWENGKELAPDADPVASFDAVAHAQPQNAPLQYELALFLVNAGRFDEAQAWIERLRVHGPSLRLAMLEAEVLDRRGERDRAGAIYRQLDAAGAARDPRFGHAHARHLLGAGQAAEAARVLERVLEIAPDSVEAWAHLATAWRVLGDAREDWLCDYERLAALVEVEPPAGESLPQFLARIEAALLPLHRASREPVVQSLRGGSQTPGCLFGRPDPAIADAEAALRAAVERHLATLPFDPRHPFLRRRARSVWMGGSWSVRLWSSGRHVDHIHPEGWMSSAFYVSLPPSVRTGDGSAGHLQLGQPPSELGLGLGPRRVLRPEPGRLALFPSYMWHGTVPFEDEEPRLTIAFDMQPRA
jgi:Flp pilus assembly protein TadD